MYNFSVKTQRRNNNNDILTYKKNSEGNKYIKRDINYIHSFDRNNSNNMNYNSLISNRNLIAFNSFDISNNINTNFNANKNEEKSQKNIIKKKLMNNIIFDNLHKNKLSYKAKK